MPHTCLHLAVDKSLSELPLVLPLFPPDEELQNLQDNPRTGLGWLSKGHAPAVLVVGLKDVGQRPAQTSQLKLQSSVSVSPHQLLPDGFSQYRSGFITL